MIFTSFSYICLSFLRLDDQMRLPFGPDYCRHYFIFLPGTYQVSYPLLLHWHWSLRCVSGGVNANCSCPCRSRIRVDGKCSYPWTPISLKCWVVFIKSIYTWLYKYFVFTSLYTDNINIFRLVFYQNLCKITHKVLLLFCCKFHKNVEEIRS